MLGEIGWVKIATLGGLEMRANTHMGMTFSHLLAGFAGFTATATVATAWYAADPSLIPIAIFLLLGLILAGVYVAIFQRSIRKNAKQVPEQSQPTESQMFQTLEHAIEEGRAGLDLDVARPPNTREEIPSPLAELALQIDRALPEPNIEPNPDPNVDPKTEHDQIAQSALNGANGNNGNNGTNGNGIAHPPPNPAREETARVSLPRLSELRGMRFSQAIRELDKAKRTAPANASPVSVSRSLNDALAYEHSDTHNGALDDSINDPISETLLSAIAPFEPMFAPAASTHEAQNGATAMHQNGEEATKDNGARGRPPLQTFFPTKPSLPAKSRGHREEDDGRSPREPKAPGKETGGFLDQLHILPSRRGQYKKKG
jgi:hypothetical protein